MTYLIDSCVLIAFFRTSEKNHAKARAFIHRLKNFYITDYVLLEVATVLQIKEGLSIAHKAITLITNNESVRVLRMTDYELVETTAFFLTQKEQISFIDASLIIVAKKNHFLLATLDKKLTKAAQQLIDN